MVLTSLRYLLCCLLFTAPVYAFGQGSVSGKLTDGKAPISYATVTVLRTDSSVVNGDLSKEDGSFNVAPVSDGSYLLRVESIGYATKFLNVTVAGGKDAKQGNIVLKANTTNLAEVNITAEKRVMELKVDKKVFNVEKNTTTAGGSATDVLQNVPSVSVDADGTVNLRGKSNVTILIDGKPATMLGSDITSALQSLPAGSIESVEVITNPSARYDAQGTTGIINIVTKKDGRFGINGNVSVGAGTRDKYNANAGITVRKGKWSTFLNLSGRQNHTFNNVVTDRQDLPKNSAASYYTYEHVPRRFNGSFNSIGATYDINKNNSITLTENVNIMEFSFRDSSDYYVYPLPERNGAPTFHRFRNTYFSGAPVSLSTSLDYRKKFNKKGRELNVDGTYAKTQMTRHQDYLTIIDVNGNPTYLIKSNAPGGGGNSSLNVWADYVDPITKNGKLGIGFKSQFYNFNSDNHPVIDTADITPDKEIRVDSSQFTIYNYDQQIHAAYVNWSDQVDKFSYQAGLRVEDAIYRGTGQVPRPTPFHNEFLNLFPSAFVSYQLPKDQSVYINYSRRTNRPNFMQLMPFKDFSNPGTVSMGNPNIRPEFINNIEVSYSRNTPKGHTYILSSYFAQTLNLSERVLRPITAADSVLGLAEQVGQLLSQPVNIASGTTYGLEGTARLQLTKIWDATLSGNFFTNALQIGDLGPQYTALIANTGGQAWFGKVNSNLKLPKNFSLQMNGNYESKKKIAQGEQRQSYWIDLAVKKNFWNNKASLTINCSDVMKTRRFINEYTTTAYTQTINRTKETRIGNISFTYRFGKTDNGKQGMGGGGGRASKREKRVEPPSDEDRGKNLKQNDDDNSGGGGGGNSGGGSGGGGQRGR
ncbi:MAG: TonB-dependent receptor [Taibaiella sp.]|nr:TonB-dependent receptor [Taibaiella sp.]